jgi:hypothetical protein
MKLKPALATLVLAAASTAAWAHPGHGAEGLYHHLVDLLALGVIGFILAALWAGRKPGGKDHD